MTMKYSLARPDLFQPHIAVVSDQGGSHEFTVYNPDRIEQSEAEMGATLAGMRPNKCNSRFPSFLILYYLSSDLA